MKEIILKTESLSKSFSNGGAMQHVLKNIDLQLYRGDFTVIMGASGAGKSTLLYALSGMDTPTLGTITFADTVISGLKQDRLAAFRRRHCGFVFQQIYLIESMSIMDNVLTAGLLVNKDKKALLRRAQELFAAVDIPETTQSKFARRSPAARRSASASSAPSSTPRKSSLRTSRPGRSIQKQGWTSSTLSLPSTVKGRAS